jgi:acyl dehydratase
MTTGDLVASCTYGPITRTDIVRYQGASGDFNPIHHDQGFAEKMGYQTVLSVGMLQAGYLVTLTAEAVGPENVRSVSFRFEEPCWPGDVLDCAIRVVSVDTGAGVAELSLTAAKRAGSSAVSGTAVVALRGLESARK